MKRILLLLAFITPLFIQAQSTTSDDFESYMTGSFDGQFNPVQWTGWFGNPSNADISTDYAFNGTKSLKVWDDIAKETDIVALLGTMFSGVDSISFMQYIPTTGSGAYYNLQHNYTNLTGDWAAEVYFGTSPAAAYVQTDGQQYAFTPTFDAWVEQKFIFDFTNSIGTFYYGGVLTHTWVLNTNAAGGAGLNTINAINLFAHNNGTGANTLAYYDDMPVFSPPSYDVEVVATDFPAVYTQLTADHVQPFEFTCDVNNIGGLGVTNVNVSFDVLDGTGTNVFSETVNQASLAIGNTGAFAATNTFTPSSDTYTVIYSVTITEADANTTNNLDTLSLTFTVSDSTLAKDDGVVTGGVGVSPNASGLMGHIYDFQTADSISSVTAVFANANTGGIGDILKAHIYTIVNGQPNTLLATSQPYTVMDTSSVSSPEAVVFNFTSPIPVDSGQYLVAVEEGITNMGIAYSLDIFTPNTGFFSVDTGQTWTSFVAVNFPISVFIHPNVTGVTVPSVSTTYVKNFDGSFEIMPNPTSSQANIKIELSENQDINVVLFDVTGKALQTFNEKSVINAQYSLDLSSYPNGVYFVRLIANKQMITQRIVKQ